jgi:hypothetical protein
MRALSFIPGDVFLLGEGHRQIKSTRSAGVANLRNLPHYLIQERIFLSALLQNECERAIKAALAVVVLFDDELRTV